jgi:hypothetical protein
VGEKAMVILSVGAVKLQVFILLFVKANGVPL